jgi:hypothetical protein
MISDEAFVLSLAVALLGMVGWAFKRLPAERWQILASVPVMKDSSGQWHGLNFTYYGLLTANALVFGVAMLILLLGSLQIPNGNTLAVVGATLLVCLPAAKWVARVIEGKECTFTVAGAFFVGIFTVPLVIELLNAISTRTAAQQIPVRPTLAGAMVAYAFGEGLGRLACISFGCCYGKQLRDVHPMLQKMFYQWHFVFSGQMKKISYESGMEGKQVVPIQAITAVLYVGTGLIATLLFLRAEYALAFVLTMSVTQGWRVLSEALRADERGGGKNFSAYQLMTLIAIVCSLPLAYAYATEPTGKPDLRAGLEALWQPAIVLSLQILWGIVFLFFGKSLVTGAQITFHVHHDRI